MGSDYPSLDRAGEDFLSLDGKICHLPVTRLEEDPANPMTVKRLASVHKTGSCYCDILFEPIHPYNEGVDLVFIRLR